MEKKSIRETIMESFKKDTWNVPVDCNEYVKEIENDKEKSGVENLSIYGKNLTITIPRFNTRSNPYEEKDQEEMDNFMGLYEDEYNNGLVYAIDMSYCGKPDQWTDYFFKLNGTKKEFEAMIKKLSIDAIYMEQCSECKKTIHGSCTWGDKGITCFDCNKE